MHVPKQVVKLLKAQGYTQRTLAAAAGLHVNLGAPEFEEGECGPEEDLCFQLEAVSNIPPEDNQAARHCSKR